MTKKRKRYTDPFKQEAVRAVETRGNRTVAEVAESLGVPEHMLHAWKRVCLEVPLPPLRRFDRHGVGPCWRCTRGTLRTA